MFIVHYHHGDARWYESPKWAWRKFASMAVTFGDYSNFMFRLSLSPGHLWFETVK